MMPNKTKKEDIKCYNRVRIGTKKMFINNENNSYVDSPRYKPALPKGTQGMDELI